MDRIIRSQHKGQGSVFKSHIIHRKGAAKLRPVDLAQRHGYIKGFPRNINHHPGHIGALSSGENTAPSTNVFRRLEHRQYSTTVRDLGAEEGKCGITFRTGGSLGTQNERKLHPDCLPSGEAGAIPIAFPRARKIGGGGGRT